MAEVEARETALEAKILAWHRASEVSQRLATIPGIGPITAAAIAATASDPTQFTSGRHFAAWIGLVPRQHSTGGKEQLGPISKRGGGYLRRLLVTGSQAVLRLMRARPASRTPRLTHRLERRPWNVVATALANKTVRIAWAVMARGETYRKRAALACRSPPRLSRCRLVSPLEAGMGQASQSLARAGMPASLNNHGTKDYLNTRL